MQNPVTRGQQGRLEVVLKSIYEDAARSSEKFERGLDDQRRQASIDRGVFRFCGNKSDSGPVIPNRPSPTLSLSIAKPGGYGCVGWKRNLRFA
jgi:hypothetical protein